MIIKVTDRCERGCSHCMYDCTPVGKDMELSVFKTIIDKLDVPFIHIGGGEPMLHPDIIEMIEYACEDNIVRPVTVVTAGIKLYVLKKLLKKYSNLMVQITNDPRYYPKSTAIDNSISDFVRTTNPSMVASVSRIGGIVELGRAKGKYENTRTKAPCLNVLLIAFQIMKRDHKRPSPMEIELTLSMNGQFCSMNIDPNGNLNAGECKFLKLSNMLSDRWWEEALDTLMNYNTKLHCNECGFSSVDTVNNTLPNLESLIANYKDTFKEEK